jgi:hypothetical protein
VSDTNDPVPCTLVESGVTIAPTLYHTQSMLIQAGHSDASDSSRGNVYSQIHSSIIIERQPGFFWWNAIFPTFLFTNLTFLSMAIPAEEAADRLAVTVSLILTAGAYKIIAANAVPEIPHLTLLDQVCTAGRLTHTHATTHTVHSFWLSCAISSFASIGWCLSRCKVYILINSSFLPPSPVCCRKLGHLIPCRRSKHDRRTD